MSNIIKFGICADVHHDLVPDAKLRLGSFLEHAQKENVDFIINLGDLCFPNSCNDDFYALWQSFNGPRYHVLGNHDMDHNTKEQAVKYFNMPSEYYSFDVEDIHFIVMDPNNLKLSYGYENYSFGNYFFHKDKINWITQMQLEWLKQDLQNTNKKTVIFSHQSLESCTYGAKNVDELHKIFLSARDENDNCKILACFNGHDHTDGVQTRDGIYYITINSMSFFYMCDKINITRYSKEMSERYPILRESVPYKEGLHTIITISDKYIEIGESKSEFVGPSPLESGHCGSAGGLAASACIMHKKLPILNK